MKLNDVQMNSNDEETKQWSGLEEKKLYMDFTFNFRSSDILNVQNLKVSNFHIPTKSEKIHGVLYHGWSPELCLIKAF